MASHLTNQQEKNKAFVGLGSCDFEHFRTTVEQLLKNCRTTVEQLSNNCRTTVKQLSNNCQTTVKQLSNKYQTTVEQLSNTLWTTLEYPRADLKLIGFFLSKKGFTRTHGVTGSLVELLVAAKNSY
jgi:hypothetical protein